MNQLQKSNTCKLCNQVVMLDLECDCSKYLCRIRRNNSNNDMPWFKIQLQDKTDQLEWRAKRLIEKFDLEDDEIIFVDFKRPHMRYPQHTFKCLVEVMKHVDVDIEKVKPSEIE